MSDTAKEVGGLLGLIIHDLRNPTATIGANVAYVKEVLPAGDEDLAESLADVEQALQDLMRGMEQVAWLGRWLAGRPTAMSATDADVRLVLRDLAAPAEGLGLRLELPDEPLLAEGGSVVRKLVEVMIANSVQHARRGEVVVSASREDNDVVVTVMDGGPAVAAELRETCFSLEGQNALKGRPDGRYGRVLGLFSTRILAEGIGGTVEAGGEDGAATFTLRLRAK